MTLAIVLFSCVVANQVEVANETDQKRKVSCGAITLATFTCGQKNFHCIVRTARKLHKSSAVKKSVTKTIKRTKKATKAIKKAKEAERENIQAFHQKNVLSAVKAVRKIAKSHPALKQLRKIVKQFIAKIKSSKTFAKKFHRALKKATKMVKKSRAAKSAARKRSSTKKSGKKVSPKKHRKNFRKSHKKIN